MAQMPRNVVCPFCGEDDFDLPGLAHHLEMRGWCTGYSMARQEFVRQLADTMRENERLREALRYYANADHVYVEIDNDETGSSTTHITDDGKVAQKALSYKPKEHLDIKLTTRE